MQSPSGQLGVLKVCGHIVEGRIHAGQNVDVADGDVVEDAIGGADHPALRLHGPPGDSNARGNVPAGRVVGGAGIPLVPARCELGRE